MIRKMKIGINNKLITQSCKREINSNTHKQNSKISRKIVKPK